MVEPKGGARGPWQKVLHALQEPFKRASAHDERTVRQYFAKFAQDRENYLQ